MGKSNVVIKNSILKENRNNHAVSESQKFIDS